MIVVGCGDRRPGLRARPGGYAGDMEPGIGPAADVVAVATASGPNVRPLGEPVIDGPSFLKGHGTQNDFVLLPDLADTLELTPDRIRALCDRRAGLGADGVIRIVAVEPPGSGYFMDYRNADGSIAEMCGNGARVFARYLVDAGLESPGSFTIHTRAGARTATLGVTGDVSIDMGVATVGAEGKVGMAGDLVPGLAVDVGNPHLVCMLETVADLAAVDLRCAPDVDAGQFPAGVNVEFVVPLGQDRIRMRVFERGVGETRSCGTGTVAAAAAFLVGRSEVGPITVEVPGGTVEVRFSADGVAVLRGNAVVVAAGQLSQQWWDRC